MTPVELIHLMIFLNFTKLWKLVVLLVLIVLVRDYDSIGDSFLMKVEEIVAKSALGSR